MPTYNWKQGVPFDVDAEVAYQRIEEIRSRLSPAYDNEDLKEAIIADARSEDSPLHDEFEWDDEVAAHRYRKKTAGKMARSIEVTYERKEEGPKSPTRVYVNVNEKGARGRYEPVADVLSDEEKRERAMKNALQELLHLQEKYSEFEDLCNLFSSVRECVKEKVETS